MAVTVLPAERFEEVVTVLCDAFFDYPVMRFVLGDRPDYGARLRRLIGLFVAARVSRDELMLGVEASSGDLTAAALVNLPGDRAAAPWFDELREAVWAELGHAERTRYDAFGAASHAYDPPEPHHHLGMIGVRGSHRGTGLGRVLLERVHQIAATAPESAGVSLTTELPANVTLYEHFGYRVAGHSRIAPELETWSMFRPC
jgi:GNAT superfamily N-acetyltransferase